LVVLLPGSFDDENTLDRKLSLAFLMATSAACIALSAINLAKALWIYVLNFGEPLVARWVTVEHCQFAMIQTWQPKHSATVIQLDFLLAHGDGLPWLQHRD
jgi:hypothetical protein